MNNVIFLYIVVLELVLLTSVTGGINGPQVGKLLTDNTNTLLTVISYNTVPELQNAVYFIKYFTY